MGLMFLSKPNAQSSTIRRSFMNNPGDQCKNTFSLNTIQQELEKFCIKKAPAITS